MLGPEGGPLPAGLSPSCGKPFLSQEPCAGIEAFCKDLGLDPSDRKILILAWKMGAKRMGYFTRDEFCYGAFPVLCHS